MNTNTGELKRLEGNSEADFPWEAIDIEVATSKQKEEMKVSLHDHRSELGKLLTRRRYRTFRKKGRLR